MRLTRTTPAALLLLALAACGKPSTPVASTTSAAAPPPAAVTITDPWVKVADKGMTAAFGTLRNDTDAEATVTGATSPVSVMELHEMATSGGKMVMRPKPGGFVIPARGTHELKAGGDHLMLMNLTKPVRAGDRVEITLSLKDGRTLRFTAVAKPFAGGNESYQPHG